MNILLKSNIWLDTTRPTPLQVYIDMENIIYVVQQSKGCKEAFAVLESLKFEYFEMRLVGSVIEVYSKNHLRRPKELILLIRED